MLSYAYTILYVADVKTTLDFYTRAFGFTQKFISPEGDYGELISGETSIAFASKELGESNFKNGFQLSRAESSPFGIELAFTTNALASDFKRAVEAGATVVSDISKKPWGQEVSYVRDINGFLIELCTPMSS